MESSPTIGIIGLGLIGGSLGLDLKQAGYRVLGVARRAVTRQQALAQGVVDQAAAELALLQPADLVVICTPIAAILPTLDALVPWLRPQAVVTDVGSVKGEIVAAATQRWANFVGGHPMAGKATAGLESAEAGLFRGKPYVLTPIAQTRPTAAEALITLIHQVGAILHQCSPEQHDRAVAWISHLPVMVSSSLIQACGQEPDPTIRQLAVALASSGFRDTSRVGGGVPELGLLMARYNRSALLASLHSYQQNLAHLCDLMAAEDWAALEAHLSAAQQARPAYLDPPPERPRS